MTRAAIRFGLLGLALAGIGYVVLRDAGGPDGDMREREPIPPEARLVVYYLSTGKECVTCEQIPAYAQAALHDHFLAQVKSGEIAWRAYDVDLPAHAHFVTDFGIYTKSIVLAEVDRGRQVRWKHLEKVWDLLGDRAAFTAYLVEEVNRMLKAAP